MEKYYLLFLLVFRKHSIYLNRLVVIMYVFRNKPWNSDIWNEVILMKYNMQQMQHPSELWSWFMSLMMFFCCPLRTFSAKCLTLGGLKLLFGLDCDLEFGLRLPNISLLYSDTILPSFN